MVNIHQVLIEKWHPALYVSILFFLSGCDNVIDSGIQDWSVKAPVVVIGDSISNGYNIAEPWPRKLADELGINISNNSISGEQTDYGLTVIENLLDQNKPEHLFIMLGTNDAERGSVSVAINNLQRMVDIARSRNVIPVVATLPPIKNSTSANEATAKISSGIRGLNGAIVVEVRNAFGDGASLLADGVHPNEVGQQVIADVFRDAL